MTDGSHSRLDIEDDINEALKEALPQNIIDDLKKLKEDLSNLTPEQHEMFMNAQRRHEAKQKAPTKTWYCRNILNSSENPIISVMQKLSPEACKVKEILQAYSVRQYISIRMSDLATLTGWSRKTASKYFRELVNATVLIKVKDSAGTNPAVYQWNYCFVQSGKGKDIMYGWKNARLELREMVSGERIYFCAKTTNVTLAEDHSRSVVYFEPVSEHDDSI